MLKRGFTLAEVLITLAIIGVVAALSIPSVVRNYQTMQYKTAYKKAYSDMNRAFAQAIAFDELEPRTAWYDLNATKSEWEVMKKNFKVIKLCPTGSVFSCWVDADRICTGSCTGPDTQPGKGGVPTASRGEAFIDASGRAWAQYTNQENIYLVDTNGDKKPNQFGKDRWQLSLKNVQNNRVEKGLPAKILPYMFSDITTDHNWCNHPPCYYKSWLAN